MLNSSIMSIFDKLQQTVQLCVDEGFLDSYEEVEFNPQKKARKLDQIQWSDYLNGRLVYFAHKHKAYLKKSGDGKKGNSKIDERWETVISNMFLAGDIKGSKVQYTVEKFKKQFNRLKLSVEKRFLNEGSNLSGLPENWDAFPEYYKTLYNICMEIGEYKENKKALTTKERQMQMKMLGHEKRVLNLIDGSDGAEECDKHFAEMAAMDGDALLFDNDPTILDNKRNVLCTPSTISKSNSDLTEEDFLMSIKLNLDKDEKRKEEKHQMEMELFKTIIEVTKKLAAEKGDR